MAYIGQRPANRYSRIDKQVITGDGGTTYTLDYTVANENELEVFVNNVRQEPGNAYVAFGTTLSMTDSVTANDGFYVVFQGKSNETISIPEKNSGGYNFANGTLFIDVGNSRVGIKTFSPSSELDVNGTITANSVQLTNATISISDDSQYALRVVQSSNGGALLVQGSSAGSIETLVDAASITPDFGSNNNFQVTINGNRVVENPLGPTPGQSGVIYIVQGIGSNTIAWGNTWKFSDNTAPILSTANGAVDAIVYAVRDSNSIVASVIYNVG